MVTPPPVNPRKSGGWKGPVFILIWLLVSGLLAGGFFLFLDRGASPGGGGPVIRVTVNRTGAPPLELESEICEPVERWLGRVEGIAEMRATIVEGRVDVDLEFSAGARETDKLRQVRDALAEVDEVLPDAEALVLHSPGDRVVSLVFSGDTPFVLTGLADKLAEGIRRRTGIRRVEVVGGSDPIVGVWFDPDRIRTWGLEPVEILPMAMRALEETARSSTQDFSRAMGPFGIKTLVLGQAPDGVEVRMRDVAMVRGDSRPRDSRAWSSRAPVVVLRVVCREGADDALINEYVPFMREGLRPGFSIEVWEESDPDSFRIAAQVFPAAALDMTGDVRDLPGGGPGVDWLLWERPGTGRCFLRGGNDASVPPDYLLRLRREAGVRAVRSPPPGLRPVRVFLACDDLDLLYRAANSVVEHLPPFVAHEAAVHDLAAPGRKLRIVIDEDRAAALGLTRSQVRRQISMQMEGAEIGEIGGATILAHLGEGWSDRKDQVGDTLIWTATGTVPATEVVRARLETTSSCPLIRHRNGLRSATVYPPYSTEISREVSRDLIAGALSRWSMKGVTVTIEE